MTPVVMTTLENDPPRWTDKTIMYEWYIFDLSRRRSVPEMFETIEITVD